MQIHLAYGKAGIPLHLPDNLDVTCINPHFVPGLQDSRASLRSALENPIALPPLSEIVKPGSHVGIIFSDLTRPTPNQLIIPAISW